MRESVGATWIFSICLTFIILFTAYLAISVNYAKAFRIKSYVVSKIEEYEGIDEDLSDTINTYLTSLGYNVYGKCESTYKSMNSREDEPDWVLASCVGQRADNLCRVCVYERKLDGGGCTTNGGNNNINAVKSYYRVIAFFRFDLPVVNTLTTFQVSGESKLVQDVASCRTAES